MTCRFGSVEVRRPVTATVCWKVVWIRPSAPISLISPATVVRSRARSRCRSRICGRPLSVRVASQVSASASVEYPDLIFFVLGRSSSSNSTSRSCFVDPGLKRRPAMAAASSAARSIAAANLRSSSRNRPASTWTPARSTLASRSDRGSSTSRSTASMPVAARSGANRPARSRTARALSISPAAPSSGGRRPRWRPARSAIPYAARPGRSRYAASAMSEATPSSRHPRSPNTRSSDFRSWTALGRRGSASQPAKARSSAPVSADGSNDAAWPSPDARAIRAMSPSPRAQVWSAASPVSPAAWSASQPASSSGPSSAPSIRCGSPAAVRARRPPPGSAANSRCRRLGLRNSRSSSSDVNAGRS